METTISTLPLVSSRDLTGLFDGNPVDITPWASETTYIRIRSIDVVVLGSNGRCASPCWLILREPGNSDVFLGECFLTEGSMAPMPYVSNEATPVTYTPDGYPAFPPFRFSGKIAWHRCLTIAPSARLLLGNHALTLDTGTATVCWERVTK